jgi:hypothetical protein
MMNPPSDPQQYPIRYGEGHPVFWATGASYFHAVSFR